MVNSVSDVRRGFIDGAGRYIQNSSCASEEAYRNLVDFFDVKINMQCYITREGLDLEQVALSFEN